MVPGDGRQVNLWEVAAVFSWVAAVSLIVADWILNKTFGHLGAFGGLSAAVAMTLTIRCIAQKHLEATCRQMRNAFQLGQDSVRQLPGTRK